MDKSKHSGFDWAFYFFWLVGTTIGWVVGAFFIAGVSFLASGIAIGILQWLPLDHRLNRASRWIPATIAGWMVGWFLLILLNPGQVPFLTGIILGLCVGFAQWLVLRREVELAGWWIMISAVGWSTGLGLLPGIFNSGTTPVFGTSTGLGSLPGFFNSGMIPAAITGAALELLLHNPKETEAKEKKH